LETSGDRVRVRSVTEAGGGQSPASLVVCPAEILLGVVQGLALSVSQFPVGHLELLSPSQR